ncbi:hypothetical protein CVT26_007978 [Gymnopilus dilepis]|uniref:Uncharacterized protein n=1 Tax=Gymnopilus dilepis TaxID=231916 RepID=A0A409W7M8_9AGAR|nr:hypothetical protein CVT26_007978 [Gymnopilus dilepis]
MPRSSAISLAIERFIQDITNSPVDHPLDDILQDALVVEHEIRLLFGSDPENPQLQDMFLGLFDIFNTHPAARRHRARQIDPNSTDLYRRYVFPISEKHRRSDLMPSIVPNIDAFRRNWEIFTHRALLKMTPKDWKNVIAAGGSVLACVKRPNTLSSAKRLNEFYQNSIYGSSDIDLFLWGLSQEEAEIKMQDIYRAVCEASVSKVICVRKANTVSIHTKYPYRPIQIVLRLYQSPAEILAGFDIDAACCAYDGNHVWVNPRFLTALVRQSNTIDLTRRSPSYEMRLAKYARRGFEICVPTLRREEIKQSLYARDLPAFPNGLARLLVLEAAYFRPNFYTRLSFPGAPHSLQKSFCNAMARNANDLPSNNYDGNLGWAQIPYGPTWDATKIEKLVAKKDAWLNSPYNPYNEDYKGDVRHRHVFFAGSMRQCLGVFCSACGNNDGIALPESGIYIKGPIKFITVNPGRQLATGSFRPIDIGEWALEAYEDCDPSPDQIETSSECAVNGPAPLISRAINQFIQDLIDTPVDQPIDSVLENAVVAEHELRLLFGAGHQVFDRFLGLINVFSLSPVARRTRARHADQSSREFNEHYILPLKPRLRRDDLMPSTVFNIEAFKNQWDLFTHGALSKMRAQDWDNVIAAGGSVLACLLPPPANCSERRINKHFQSDIWALSDIDLFLWGLTSEQAEAKMEDIFKAICAAAPWKVVCVRRYNTVSIHTTYPIRPIQIVLRIYQSPAEILAGFDVDACCVLYNGKNVWANPRAISALVRQCNTVDITRRSPSYETRLAKYAQRGFEVLVPSLDRGRVKSSIYDEDLRSFPNGLARLLVLEAMCLESSTYRYLPHLRAEHSKLTKSYYDDELKWVKIPYGPTWDAERIQKIITRKDAFLNSLQNSRNEGRNAHKHMFVVGSMRQCLRPACQVWKLRSDGRHSLKLSQQCHHAGTTAAEPDSIYIKGPIRFMTTNPGRQLMTGSFRPIDHGDWEREAYDDQEELTSRVRRVVLIDSDSDDEDGDSEYTDTVSELAA